MIGEPAVLGSTSGFSALVKKETPHVIPFQIVLHQCQRQIVNKNVIYSHKSHPSAQSQSLEFLSSQEVLLGKQNEVLCCYTEIPWFFWKGKHLELEADNSYSALRSQIKQLFFRVILLHYWFSQQNHILFLHSNFIFAIVII